jgi:hypothetical protein
VGGRDRVRGEVGCGTSCLCMFMVGGVMGKFRAGGSLDRFLTGYTALGVLGRL